MGTPPYLALCAESSPRITAPTNKRSHQKHGVINHTGGGANASTVHAWGEEGAHAAQEIKTVLSALTEEVQLQVSHLH